MRFSTFALTFVLLLIASVVQAQVVNPTLIEFTSADHAIVTRYEIGYFAGTASSPTQTVSVPKAEFTPIAGGYYQHPLPRPVLGNYTAKVRAFGVDAAVPAVEVPSAWSDPSGPFTLSPRVPAGPRVVP